LPAGTEIEGACSQEIVSNINGVNSVVKLHTYNKNNKINKLRMLKGSAPQKKNECLIDTALEADGYKVGDSITVQSEYLEVEILKITGIVQSPLYLTCNRGNASVLSGKINYYVYVSEDNVKSDYYTEAYIKYPKTDKPFTKTYANFIEENESLLDEIFSNYFNKKYETIIQSEQQKLNLAKKEYEEKKREVETQLKYYEDEIAKNEEKIKETESKVTKAEDIEEKVQTFLDENKVSKEELDALKKQLDLKKNQLEYIKKDCNKDIEEYESDIASYNEEIAEENEEKDELLNGDNEGVIKKEGLVHLEEELRLLQQEGASNLKIRRATRKIEDRKEDIEECDEKIAEYNSKIQEATRLINESKTKLTTINDEYEQLLTDYTRKNAGYQGNSSYDEVYSTYVDEKKKVEDKINTSKKELADAKQLYSTKKEEAYKELDKVALELGNAQDKINMYSNLQNYIFNRNDNTGYSQFVDDTSTIENLGKIVPILFYFIAFIMISASITKILFMERNQIGTLKALGFGSSEIRIKYTIYSLMIVFIGSIVGVIIGVVVLPYAIYTLYKSIYEFPYFKLSIDIVTVLIAILIAVAVALCSTYISSSKTLKEIPVSLLKVKVEKFAKKGLIEKIGFIWNKLKFSSRIALKNVFKYKLRVFMTVMGVGGCVALMITGFSLRSSIAEMIPKQYGEIFKLQAQLFYKDDITREEINNSTQKIKNLSNVKDVLATNMTTMSAKSKVKSYNVNMVVFDQLSTNYSDFIAMNSVNNNQKIELASDGVVVTQKLAELLELKVADNITLYDSKKNAYALKVKDITKNYMDHYVYMNSAYYQTIFNNVQRNNMLLVKTKGKYNEMDFAKELNDLGSISRIVFTSVAETFYDEIMSILSLVVVIFISFSMLLIFAVLYNLINMNVMERIREIATYKVLGFSNRVISSIMKKENNILLLIGIVLGTIAGKYLSIAVIKMCEIENFSFIKQIEKINYVNAIAITVVFTIICGNLINAYVKKVDLIETLKKNE